jgi:DNA polymerase III subunit epsilon
LPGMVPSVAFPPDRPTGPTGGPSPARQMLIDDLGTPLPEVCFVILDLETTGGSPEDSQITEVGAVKVRGGEVLGEFQTLVNPGGAIPPFISVLTGITDAMVAGAPRMEAALPPLLEFLRGAVLVAHNAPFDVAFLRAACAAHGYPWPAPTVLDTARLARRALLGDEVPNCKLATLARFFRSGTTPNHRALSDARATVDVLHGLIARVGNQGVGTLEELVGYSTRVSPAQRRKRHLADDLPNAPGVYLFTDRADRVLYIGKSKDLRTRVRAYFTASEGRRRMAEMVALAERVVPIRCEVELEAEVRELRLIAEHKPPYNRRSCFPERSSWVKITVEPFPRLSIVRRVLDDGATYLGPFSSAAQANATVAAVYEAFPVRQCRARLSPRVRTPACVLAELHRCNAPCDGRESVEDYGAHVAALRAAVVTDPHALVDALRRRIDALGAEQRYEEAAEQRDRLAAFVRGAARLQRLTALTGCAELVAARPAFTGGWELVVVRHGRLAAAGCAPRGAAVRPYIDALVATAETVVAGPGPLPASSAEEVECVLRWLERPGTRLVELEGTWACPVRGAGGLTGWLEAARPGRGGRWLSSDR